MTNQPSALAAIANLLDTLASWLESDLLDLSAKDFYTQKNTFAGVLNALFIPTEFACLITEAERRGRKQGLEEALVNIKARSSAEKIMRDQTRKHGDQSLANAHGDRAAVLDEQASAISDLIEG